MKNLKIYQTNSGLGYRQLAYLLKLNDTEYLCIGGQNIELYDKDNMYCLGEIDTDEGDTHLEPTNFRIEESPLYNKYLFDYFLENKFKE